MILLFLTGCTQESPKKLPQDQLTVEYSINRDTILIGDPVELILTAYYPTNGTLELPALGREKDILLLKRDWQELAREDGLKQSETIYSLTSFRLGEHSVSTGMITCVAGDQTMTVPFPQVTLTVRSSLTVDDSSQIADIKPVQKLPGRIPPWLWISVCTALAAFVIGLISSRYRKRREAAAPAPPQIPAHIIALSALEALKIRDLLAQDEYKAFYTELSLILRTYLEGRFHLNAPDETTEEIVEELSRSPELNGNQRNILQEFMRQADMVKFAKGRPDRTTMESAFNTTKQFVEETQRIETDD